MSSTLIEAESQVTRAKRSRSALPDWMREPLLHFLLLGAALFAIDHLLVSRTDDPRTIVIDAEVDRQAIQVFESARGRQPDEKELFALRRIWLDNEVLYREGMAMGLEKGDKAIRERVIFKALSVVDAGVKLPPYTEASLRAWFEQQRSRYDEPARLDFEEAVVSGDRTEASVRAFAQALNAGGLREQQAGLRVFTGRPLTNIVQSYGDEFAAALQLGSVDEWQVLRSRESWRVIRLKHITAAKPAEFAAVSGTVLQDWTDTVMAQQRSDAVQALARKYRVKVADAKS